MVASAGKIAGRALKLSCLLVAAVSLLVYLSSSTDRTATWSHLASRAILNPRDVNNLPVNELPHQSHWLQQNIENAPALPIIELSKDFILAAMNDTSAIPKDAFFTANESSISHNATLGVPKLGSRGRYKDVQGDITPFVLNHPLGKRAAEPCAQGKPCPDKSCSKGGKCGYGPDYCSDDNCISNCNSTAMCGRYSEGASLKCGMNLCCSYYGWCGTDELHCGNPDENKMTPCQEKFGLCTVIPAPSCDAGASSANGRTIGYYQASNTRDRICNRMSPSHINTDGLTHLYYAFAKIDPNSFATVPANDGDEDRYTDFTKLQSSRLRTWIAIGGFDFSDPGPTRSTWSDLSSSQANRATFISGLKDFMSKYGFQGVDLDWEYPGTPERGGKQDDTAKYVSLAKEMKAAFGDQYGLSLTLAPDYWYLRGFDAKAMEPYVDFFGFMAYDLHGFWDADIETLGSKVRGQTDIREIYNDTLPLWFDDLNPSKINFGLAYYGRGYTLASAGCNQLECPFSGPSLPGPCTSFNGVLSLAEIKSYIREKGLKPQLLEESMMKQITWDDQWIGYDDEETVEMKKKFASGMCFGGTMIWSVDFQSGDGINDENPEDSAPKTKDGRCGPENGGTVCGDWPDGGCCSSSGYCGRGVEHCGNGCLSGPCQQGRETTDGSCGPLHGGSICGSWSGGACCSSSGFCGADDAHCGASCISGPCDSSSSNDGGGVIYVDPSLWSNANPTIYCNPPCLYILPPLTLSSTTTISFPPFTTSLEVAWKTSKVTTLDNGQVSTSTGFDRIIQTTVLTIPPVTTDKIDLWNVNVTSGVKSSIIQITRSILPPPFTITDDQNPLSLDGVTHPPVTRTITPPPYPYPNSEPIPVPWTLDSTAPGGSITGGSAGSNSPGGALTTSNSPGGAPTGSSSPGGAADSTNAPPIIPPDITTSGGVFPYPTTSGYLYPPQFPCSTCYDPPEVTHSAGDPKSHCKTGCGHACNPAVGLAAAIPVFGQIASAVASVAFCNQHCYINCAGLNGFLDPIDTNPPGPPPGPPPGTGGSDSGGAEPDENESTTSCSTSVVTDFFVSCTSLTSGSGSGTLSCQTTSSSLVSGCKITPTATTTSASSCPLVSDVPDEDQGEDGDATPPTSVSRKATTTTVGHVTTKFTPLSTANPSCSSVNEDPGRGINSPYCVCDGSKTYPDPWPKTSNCAYDTLPQTIDAKRGELQRHSRLYLHPNPNPTPTPSPLPYREFHIGFFYQDCDTSGLKECADNSIDWNVITRVAPVPSTGFDLCLNDPTQREIWTSKDQKHDLLGDNLRFPLHTDRFQGEIGEKGNLCTYSQFKQGEVGEFKCTDNSAVKCVLKQEDRHHVDKGCKREGNLPDWHQEALCTYGDPPVSIPDPDPTISTTFSVGYFDQYGGDKPGRGTTARDEKLWAIFAVSPDSETDFCTEDPTFTEPNASGTGTSIVDSYPLTLGEVNAAGTRCFYRLDSGDERGVVTCGGQKVDCVEDTSRVDQCKGDRAWHPHDKCTLTV